MLFTYVSDTRALNLQKNSPKGHGYWCQYMATSFGRPETDDFCSDHLGKIVFDWLNMKLCDLILN